jgi:hypothetical protein
MTPLPPQVLPSIFANIIMLDKDCPVVPYWSTKILMPKDLRPEVLHGRQELYDDLVDRWVTNFPEDRLRFFCIATLFDPRLKAFDFPGEPPQHHSICCTMASVDAWLAP